MSLANRLVALLSRRTSGRSVIREIDGLRAVAILSVLVFHAGGNFFVYTDQSVGVGMSDAWLTTLLSAGEFGVPLFFAISGFVLALPFAQQRICRTSPVSLRKYFTRRLTRLEPPYFLALLGAFVAMSLRDHNFHLWPNLLASMFYLHNTVFGEPSKVLGVAWSLEVEVQFYILAPLICCVFSIRRTWLRRLIVMSGMTAASVLFEVGPAPLGSNPGSGAGNLNNDGSRANAPRFWLNLSKAFL